MHELEKKFGSYILQKRNPQYSSGEYSRAFLIEFEDYVNSKDLNEFIGTISQISLLEFLATPSFIPESVLPELITQVSLFPSPASENITISFPQTTFLKTTIKLRDITGREMFLKEIPAGESSHTFSLKELPVGMYVVEVHSGSEVFVQQVGVVR